MSRDSSADESVSSGGAAHTMSEKYRPMAAGRGGLRAMMARDAPNAQPAQGGLPWRVWTKDPCAFSSTFGLIRTTVARLRGRQRLWQV